MVADLTGMPLSNCSLLDEATAAAEAMTMCTAQSRQKKLKFLVSVSSPAGLRLCLAGVILQESRLVPSRLRQQILWVSALPGRQPAAGSADSPGQHGAPWSGDLLSFSGVTLALLLCWCTPRAAGWALVAYRDQAAAWCSTIAKMQGSGSDLAAPAVQDKCHPETMSVLESRASGLGLTVEVGDEKSFNIDKDVSGVLLQYPATDGSVHDYKVSIITASGRVNYVRLPCKYLV